jgi:hypothetical protein
VAQVAGGRTENAARGPLNRTKGNCRLRAMTNRVGACAVYALCAAVAAAASTAEDESAYVRRSAGAAVWRHWGTGDGDPGIGNWCTTAHVGGNFSASRTAAYKAGHRDRRDESGGEYRGRYRGGARPGGGGAGDDCEVWWHVVYWIVALTVVVTRACVGGGCAGADVDDGDDGSRSVQHGGGNGGGKARGGGPLSKRPGDARRAHDRAENATVPWAPRARWALEGRRRAGRRCGTRNRRLRGTFRALHLGGRCKLQRGVATMDQRGGRLEMQWRRCQSVDELACSRRAARAMPS